MQFAYFITMTPTKGPVSYWTGKSFFVRRLAKPYATRAAAGRALGGIRRAYPVSGVNAQIDYLQVQE